MNPNAVRFPREILDLARRMKILDSEEFSEVEIYRLMDVYDRHHGTRLLALPAYRPRTNAYSQS